MKLKSMMWWVMLILEVEEMVLKLSLINYNKVANKRRATLTGNTSSLKRKRRHFYREKEILHIKETLDRILL